MSSISLKYKDIGFKLFCDEALEALKKIPDASVQSCVTSPPYYMQRDYGHPNQIGLEASVNEYITKLVVVFNEVKRVLKNNGTLWVNISDTYVGGNRNKSNKKTSMKNSIKNQSEEVGKILPHGKYKRKDLMLIPFELALALRNAGWYLRQDIIWNKPNAMPESVKDRCTKSHEYVWLLAKSEKYYFDYEGIKEPAKFADEVRGSKGVLGPLNKGNRKTFRGGGSYTNANAFTNSNKIDNKVAGNNNISNLTRNKRSVWNISTRPSPYKHFATFPPELIKPMIVASTKEADTVLDVFMGTGTTGDMALSLKRNFIGIDIVQSNFDISLKRLQKKFNEIIVPMIESNLVVAR